MPVNHSFAVAYKAVRIIETLENYAVADQIESKPVAANRATSVLPVRNEDEFWDIILDNPANTFDQRFSLMDVGLSEWVPRVPGLQHASNNYVNRVNSSNQLTYPVDESFTLLRGEGTNLLAPSGGYRIVSVCSYNSASRGIPVLIADSVWDEMGLKSGDTVSLKQVPWRRMTSEWAQRFEIVKGIPRAYLTVEDKSQIIVQKQRVRPLYYQPYTLIEYVKNDVLLYDYLIRNVSVDISADQLSDEFDSRRKRHYPSGHFLLNPDPANPWFEDAYNSPDQLRQAQPGSSYHLSLIKERIRGTYFSGKLVEDIQKVLSLAYTEGAAVKVIARHLGFPTGTFASSRAADRIAQLVDWCIDTPDKMEELVDKLVIEQPDLLHK